MTYPNYYAPAPKSSPGKLAAVLQSIFAFLMLIYALLMGCMAIFWSQVIDILNQQGTRLPIPDGINPDEVRIAVGLGSILIGVVALLLLICAVFVYRGRKAPAVISMIVLGLAGLWLGLSALGTVGAPGMGGLGGAFGLIISVGMAIFCAATIYRLWLVLAAPRRNLMPSPWTAQAQIPGQMMSPMHSGFPPQWMPPPGAGPIGMEGNPSAPPPEEKRI